ncbi:MAG: hypothetical protein JWL68_2710 [Actinomycetia bacterium]|jgi:hypothetical protein|nr:hypothetical protein [Actinomycetes bacterium]
MVQSHNPVARHPKPDGVNGDRKGKGWPIAAACLPMLAGAAAFVLADRAGLVFLTLFVSCTALVALMMAGIGSPHWMHPRHHRVPARRFLSR